MVQIGDVDMQPRLQETLHDIGTDLSQQNLSDLWRLFDRLIHYRNSAAELQSAEISEIECADHRQSLMEMFLDPIDEKLAQLAWLAVDLPANTSDERQIKARILNELLEEGEPDVGNALTRSLIRDITK